MLINAYHAGKKKYFANRMAFCPSQPLYIMKGSRPFAEIEPGAA
jgi:hypothetical protein